MRNRRQQRRQKYINMMGGKCVQCGSTKDLQFDHKNPKHKNHDLNDIKDGDEDRITKELAKCVLLCPNCHLQKTKDNKEHVNKDKQPSRHGKIWHYKRYGCRCRKCRLAMRLYNLRKKEK
jgi:5-methylcytosine-specific restriction endonuclease McrA